MNTEFSSCKVVVLAPTKEQAMAVVDTWKKAEIQFEGVVDHEILVAGEKWNVPSSKCKIMMCFTAESQEDWDKVKKEWEVNLKDKCKDKCDLIVAANKEEKSKKWSSDIKAKVYVDLSKYQETMLKLKKELENVCQQCM
jgi:hypothetical protein